MTDKQIIHGEQVPLITLTRQQLEEDWFTLWELYKAKEQECNKKSWEIGNLGYKIKNQRKEINIRLEQLDQLKQTLTKIFACLINANRADKITDTLWVGGAMTLWDYIAQALGIEGDQLEVEEQILQKISEVE